MFGRKSLISERPFDGIQIVGSNRYQRPSPAYILVELILQIYEALVVLLVERDVTKNRANDEGTDSFHFFGDDYLLERGRGRFHYFVYGWFIFVEIDSKSSCQSFDA